MRWYWRSPRLLVLIVSSERRRPMAFDILNSGDGKSYNYFFKNFTWRTHPHDSLLICRILIRKLLNNFRSECILTWEIIGKSITKLLQRKKIRTNFSCLYYMTYVHMYMLEHVAVTMVIMMVMYLCINKCPNNNNRFRNNGTVREHKFQFILV